MTTKPRPYPFKGAQPLALYQVSRGRSLHRRRDLARHLPWSMMDSGQRELALATVRKGWRALEASRG